MVDFFVRMRQGDDFKQCLQTHELRLGFLDRLQIIKLLGGSLGESLLADKDDLF